MVPARAEKRKGAVPRRPFFDQKSALGRLLVAVLALALPLALPVLALGRGRRAGRGGRPGRAGGGASRAGGLRAVTARADRDVAVAHVFFVIVRRHPNFTLFLFTTLFRSTPPTSWRSSSA